MSASCLVKNGRSIGVKASELLSVAVIARLFDTAEKWMVALLRLIV